MESPVRRTLTAAIVFLALIPAGASGAEPSNPPQAKAIPLDEDAPYVHRATGFAFPAEVSLFDRVSAHRYDDAERNVAVGYIDRGLKIILTAFVYPSQGLKLTPHFEQVKADVREVHPDAKLASEGKWTVKQGDGGEALTGLRASFTFSAEFAGKPRKLLSDAYLLRQGGYFIKFRITYPADRRDEVAERVTRFFDTLKFPGAKVAPK
jgi:hypothetical protein